MLTPYEAKKEIQAKLEEIELLLHVMYKSNFEKKSCLDCIHWDHTKEICLKYNAKPPIKIIVNACPDLDYIPF